MKLPRDVSGDELARRLRGYGCEVTRRSGSRLRLTSRLKGEHHVTIPAHAALRVGTLNSILTDVAAHFERDKAEVMRKLFG